MSNVLEPSEAALNQGNWSLLYQCLQHVLADCPLEQQTDKTSARLLELAIAVLEAGDFQLRWDVVKLLSAFGDRAIDPLIDLIQADEADLEVRWFAARALGGYTQPRVIRALLALLQTADQDELRSIAAEALAHIGSPVVAALTEMLALEDTRLFAVRSLATIRHTETIAPLLTVVQDTKPAVRAIALGALGSFPDPRVPPVLIRALQDQEATVRQVAVEELGFCNTPTLQLDVIKLVSAYLQDQDAAVCHAAAIALGRLGTDAAADRLFTVLTSPISPLLQTEIIWALHRIGTTIALGYLQQALHQCNQPASLSLYHTILTAVGRWEGVDAKPQAAQLLAEALATPFVAKQPMLKQAIATGLGTLSQPKMLKTLIQLLASEEMSVRLHAIAALKALDAKTAHEQLEVLVVQTDAPEALKQGAAIALQEW